MVSRINECTDILMENLRKKADDVDVKRLVHQLTAKWL